MSELTKIHDVEPLDGHVLRISFSNGAVKDVDVSELLDAGGVFSAIRDSRKLFEQVRVNPDNQTIEWPGGIDLDADVLYGRFEPASGVRIARRVIRQPTAAHV